jgi:hypothetical protein
MTNFGPLTPPQRGRRIMLGSMRGASQLRAACSWTRQGGGPIEPCNDEGRLHLIPKGKHQKD